LLFLGQNELFSIYLPFIATKTAVVAMTRDFIAMKTVVVTHEPGAHGNEDGRPENFLRTSQREGGEILFP